MSTRESDVESHDIIIGTNPRWYKFTFYILLVCADALHGSATFIVDTFKQDLIV